MIDFDRLINQLTDPSALIEYIKESKNDTSRCRDNKSVIHHNCLFEENSDGLSKPQCPNLLIYILIKILASQPKLLEDSTRDAIASYFKTNNIKAEGLITIDNLTTLNQSKSPLMTWLKYENLLIHLIKERIYEPKTMSNETLAVVKSEINPDIASRFSSVLSTCVKHCRDSNRHNIDEEEEEKWCEIVDWMSWFLITEEDDFT